MRTYLSHVQRHGLPPARRMPPDRSEPAYPKYVSSPSPWARDSRLSEPLLRSGPSTPALLLGFILAVSLAWVRLLPGAELYGRITDTNTTQGISAATVVVKSQSPGATNELSTRSDVFGFYRLLDIPPDTYLFEVRHPAYHPSVAGDLALPAGGRLARSVALTPLNPIEPHFEVDLSVACASTGLELASVPVLIEGVALHGGRTIREGAKTDARGYCKVPGLPVGFYTFHINEGADRRPGWDTCVRQILQSLDRPHWTDVFLKPDLRSLLVSVYGYDPVQEQTNALLEGIIVELTGVHPDNHLRELLPPQSGVSGLRKDDEPTWDNTMAGRVLFSGLAPIHYQVTGKRLGYRPAALWVQTDAAAQLVPANPRLDLVMMDTRLTAVFNSPYGDPPMLHGLDVRLQGLTNSNTQGIDRKAIAVYDATNNRTTASFDRLLPGTYRLAVNSLVTNDVPIRIEGNPLPGESPTRFVARLTCEDRVDAVGDEEVEVDVALAAEPAVLRCRILLTDASHVHSIPLDHGMLDYVDCPAALQPVEIRASEYYTNHMPAEFHVVKTGTDFNGEFSVTLLPGVYGIVLPALSNYWGAQAATVQTSIADPRNVTRTWSAWPQYQRWPYSYQSLQGYSVLPVSSDSHFYAELAAWEDFIQVECSLYGPANEPTRTEVLALYKEASQLKVLFQEYKDYANGGTMNLLGGSGPPIVPRRDGHKYYFERVPPGANYSVRFDHPRYRLTPASAQESFDYFDHSPPGVLPPTQPPTTGPMPMQYKSIAGSLEFIDPGEAFIAVYKWDPVLSQYSMVATNRKPDYLKIGYTANHLFKYYSTTPTSAYEAWFDLTAFFDDGKEHWFGIPSDGGRLEKTLYVAGGPREQESAEYVRPDLRVAYNLQVLARNEAGQREALPGVEVRFSEGGTAVAGGPPITGRTKSYAFSGSNVTLPGWEYAYNSETKVEAIDDVALIAITVFMRQQTTLQGKVLNARTGNPVANAAVRLTKAQGNDGVELPLTAADGSFAYSRSLGRAVYFLEVDAPGYAPFRVRIRPEDLVPGGRLLLEGDKAIRLEPLPAPELLADSISLDRFGAFLPGVKRAGNQDVFNGFVADEPLTLTWKLLVKEPTNCLVTVPGFDTLDDQPGPVESIPLTDEVAAVWLVDARAFTNNPDCDPPIYLQLPNPAEPHLALDWIAKVRANHSNTPNVFYRRGSRQPAPASTNLSEVVGTIKLWQLPPDEFRPVFVAATKRGAVAIHPFAYTGPYAGKQLVGFRRPKWLGRLGDTLGVVAGSLPIIEDRLSALKNSNPVGRLIPLPKFTMDINKRATSFLDYTYAIDVNLIEGMPGTGGKISQLIPGRFGLDLFAGVEASLKGEDKEFNLEMRAGLGLKSYRTAPPKTGSVDHPELTTPLTANSVNAQAYAPSAFKSVDVSLKYPPRGNLVHITSQTFGNQNEPLNFRMMHGVEGEIGLECSVNLVPALGWIPYVGQTLVALNRAELVKIDGHIEGGLGLKSVTGWTTEYPEDWEHKLGMPASGTTVCEVINTNQDCRSLRQPRRHFLGGTEPGEQQIATNQFDLCCRAGLSITVDLFHGRIGGSGGIAVGGYDCWTTFKAMLCEGNMRGDWPPIRRIRGDARLEFELYLNSWWLRYGRHWEHPFMAIDCQFNTTTELYLFPLEITSSEVRPADFDPAIFDGRSPQLLRQFMPLGDYAAASSGGLVYIDMLPGHEHMGLRFARRSDAQSWAEPVILAQTPGVIVDACLALAPNQQHLLAVWTTIAPAYAGRDDPPSTLWYSVSDALGSQWSQPALLAELDAVGQQLHLVPFDDGLALVFLQSDEGIQARNFQILACRWNGGSWTLPKSLLGPTPLNGFAVAGTSNSGSVPLHVAVADDASALWVLSWDGHLVSASPALGTIAGNDLAFAQAPGTHFLTWTKPGGEIGLFEFQPASNLWSDRGVVASRVSVQELQMAYLHDALKPVLLHLWTQGGDRAAIWYLFSDLSGNPLGPAANLTANTRGHYHALSIQPRDGRRCTLLSLFRNGDVEELRQFDLEYPTGPISTDRDADGLQDRLELLIVDADPFDSLQTIDDVKPEDDFDHDGFSNRRELLTGSHPADPAVYPVLQVVLEPQAARDLGARWRLEGGAWLTSGASLYLQPGDYRVEFDQVPGWSAPMTLPISVSPASSATWICPYVQGGVPFDDWSRSQVPPLPAGQSGPDDHTGLLGLSNFAAYGLGVNPLTATAAELPQLRLEAGRLLYTYRLSKHALGAALCITFAPGLMADTTWIAPDTESCRKVGETPDSDIWELSLPALATPARGFMNFEIGRGLPSQ